LDPVRIAPEPGADVAGLAGVQPLRVKEIGFRNISPGETGRSI
jgi:hypothetical protein